VHIRPLVLLTAASFGLLCSLAAPVRAEEQARARIAVLEFAASPADRDRAKGLAGMVAAKLASSPGAQVVGLDEVVAALGLEKQKQALGCTEDGCLLELSGALGVRYLVHARLDRFGASALFSAFLFDSRAAKSLVRFSQKVDDDALLVTEGERFAAQALAALGLAPSPEPAQQQAFKPEVLLNLKLGNTLPSLKGATISNYNITFDLEGDYYLSPRWQLFLLTTITVGSATDSTGTSGDASSKSFRLFSPYAGVKVTFSPQESLRPYVGLALGLTIMNRLFSTSTGDTVGLNGLGVGGLLWTPFKRVGFNLEMGVNLSAVSSDGSGLYFGFKTNFGVVVLF
jgi:hypothetical protein